MSRTKGMDSLGLGVVGLRESNVSVLTGAIITLGFAAVLAVASLLWWKYSEKLQMSAPHRLRMPGLARSPSVQRAARHVRYFGAIFLAFCAVVLLLLGIRGIVGGH